MLKFSLAVAALLISLTAPASALASSGNGELCAVQTWDQNVVLSVHRAGFLPSVSAPRAQVDEAAGQCTNLAAIEGWMGADKNFDDWKGQVDVCWIAVNPGLAYVLHAGSDGVARAVDMCSGMAEAYPSDVTWFKAPA